ARLVGAHGRRPRASAARLRLARGDEGEDGDRDGGGEQSGGGGDRGTTCHGGDLNPRSAAMANIPALVQGQARRSSQVPVPSVNASQSIPAWSTASVALFR